jgi:alpha-tubulin suppressor-like RCC1 family protein
VARDVPRRVDGGISFTALNATGAHACGLAGDGELWCWGSNVEGQLGDGGRRDLVRPTRLLTDR